MAQQTWNPRRIEQSGKCMFWKVLLVLFSVDVPHSYNCV